MPKLEIIVDSVKGSQGARDVASALDTIPSSAAKVDKAINATDRNLLSVGRSASFLAGILRNNLGPVLGGLGFAAGAKTISDYDLALRKLSGVFVSSNQPIAEQKEQIDELSKSLRAVSANTGFGFRESSEAIVALGREGLTANQALAVFGEGVKIANSESIALGEAVGLAEDAISVFGKESLDSLAGAARVTDKSLRDIVVGLKPLSGVLRQSNIDIAEAAVVFGKLDTLGSILGPALFRLVNPTKQVSDVLKELGLTFEEIDPRRIGLISSFEKLAQAAPSAGQIEQIFGRAKFGASELIGSIDDLRALKDQASDTGFSINRSSLLIENSLGKAFRSVKTTFEALFTEDLDGPVVTFTQKVLTGFNFVLRALLGFRGEFLDLVDLTEVGAKTFRDIGIIGSAAFDTLVVSARVAVNSIRKVFLDISIFSREVLLNVFEGFQKSIASRLLDVTGVFDAKEFQTAIDAFKKEIAKSTDESAKLGFSNATLPLEIVGIQKKATVELLESEKKASEFFLANNELRQELRRKEKASIIDFQKELEGISTKKVVRGGDAASSVLSEEEINAQREYGKIVDELNKKILVEIDLVGKSTAERELSANILEFENAVKRAGLENTQKEIDKFKEKATLLRDLKDKQEQNKKAEDALRDATSKRLVVLDDVRKEISLIGLSNEEKQKQLILLEFEAQSRRVNTSEAIEDVARLSKSLEKLEGFRKLENVAASIGDAFGSAIEEIIFQVDSLNKVLENLIKNVLRAIVQETVTKPAANLVAGIVSNVGVALAGGTSTSAPVTSAKGNVFSGGDIQPFELGGEANLITRPVVFPLFGGRTGGAGEGGTEGIFPLTRNSKGQLGIRASGEQGRGNVGPVVINIRTNDASSFRKSKRQIAQQVRNTFAGIG